MASKKFGTIMLSATSYVEVFAGQSGYDTTVTINVSNWNATDSKITLAMTSATVVSTTPDDDVFELEQLVYARSSRQFPGVVFPQGSKLVVRGADPALSILVYGFEEEI